MASAPALTSKQAPLSCLAKASLPPKETCVTAIDRSSASYIFDLIDELVDADMFNGADVEGAPVAYVNTMGHCVSAQILWKANICSLHNAAHILACESYSRHPLLRQCLGDDCRCASVVDDQQF